MHSRPTPPNASTAAPSPALTIDNDSFASIRPHIMGHPGARVLPPVQVAIIDPRQPRPLHRRIAESSPLGITRHSPLHNQLLLVDAPDPHQVQALVSRISVVRPAIDDDVIVVEANRASPGATEGSVEAIYRVIGGNRPSAPLKPEKIPPPAPAVAARPIAIPKSRLGKLRPALRQLPSSRQVSEAGPAYTRNGSLRARRPESILVNAAEKQPPANISMELSDSYCNDIGYDLANADIDSLYCRSFDIDQLPDAPERKLSFYNIGAKEVLPAHPSPLPDAGLTAIQEEDIEEEESVNVEPTPSPCHRTLGIASTGESFARPAIREENVDFYIRMLTLRSTTTAPSVSTSPPTSPSAPAAVIRSSSANNKDVNSYSQRRSAHISAPKAVMATSDPSTNVDAGCCMPVSHARRLSASSMRFFFRRRPKLAPDDCHVVIYQRHQPTPNAAPAFNARLHSTRSTPVSATNT
ncbi:hypothetical protein H4R26_001360 [Coemansia thaxteri]|uniref:Uncharacterized protein n=1 Tax=Coemansia thaxteri TaxID=2663907 RepID=A0A9W8EH06_9FUNG|nr:hypothetical protein H4R26_001360 [Coemansia thaxteri]